MSPVAGFLAICSNDCEEEPLGFVRLWISTEVKKFFVTGGAGFIGSAFARLVLSQSQSNTVVNFDALTYAGNPDNLQDLDGERHHFIKGDIANRDSVLWALPDDVDVIVNFAAESHVDRSIFSADDFIRTNILGTQVLLDCARERCVRRFVQVSTDEVMGTLPEHEDAFFTEESPFAPNSPYAASKAAAEHLVRAAHQTFGLDTVITRCGNNYGPRQFPEKFLPLMIANAMNDESIPIYGDGLNVRDWIYVDDHCRAILLALEKGKSGATYNIGARNERRNLDIAKSVLDQLGKPHSLITFVKDRPGHDRRYAIDPSLTESELGWSPQETWDSGLNKTIRWYQENAKWIERARSGAYREFYARQYGVEVGA
jgi:dTDP-glucose 4,6-dehydratase